MSSKAKAWLMRKFKTGVWNENGHCETKYEFKLRKALSSNCGNSWNVRILRKIGYEALGNARVKSRVY